MGTNSPWGEMKYSTACRLQVSQKLDGVPMLLLGLMKLKPPTPAVNSLCWNARSHADSDEHGHLFMP